MGEERARGEGEGREEEVASWLWGMDARFEGHNLRIRVTFF